MLPSLMVHLIENPINSSRIDELMLIDGLHFVLPDVVLHLLEDHGRG